ncbi:MAG: hypothetical protein GY862_22040 [Gammaproteobacteria bacterium]|nr:hypothetical protein [Gammaproteobacteria bacterium]
MLKQASLSVFIVFIVWSILDFIIHGVLLAPVYAATANLWRPHDEMNMPLMSLITFVFAICFVAIYALLVEKKSLISGIKLGVLFGLATGISMGFGSYSMLPIPLSLAFSWFIGTLVELIAAGIIVGLIIKPHDAAKV